MKIPLDRQSHHPVYLQIRDYLSRLIQSDQLVADQKLPSIRSLAESLQVNKLTVIEAYGVLESDGLIHARQGSGYFVNHRTTTLTWRSEFAPAQQVTFSEGRSFFEQFTASTYAQHDPTLIDFSSGFPCYQNVEMLQRLAKQAIHHADDQMLFRHDIPQGQLALRQQIARFLLHQGLEAAPDQIIVTNGSQQALSLIMQHYLEPGDWVIVEAPTYHGALGILESLKARAIGIPMTANGMNLDLLEQYLSSHRPKLIYTISTLHNPTGITTNQAHRQQLLDLAERYHCPILEDNAYEGLNFEPVPAPIKAIDRHHLVTYVSTFTKTLIPGLRVGYMVVTGDSFSALLRSKTLHDMHVSTLCQTIVSQYLASGHYRRHLNRSRTTNLQSRNVMIQLMETHFPDSVAWTVPKGGLFLWVHLPDRVPMAEICRAALQHNIMITSGEVFFPGHSYPAMRLNFSHPIEPIERGIKVLGEIFKHHTTAELVPNWAF